MTLSFGKNCALYGLDLDFSVGGFHQDTKRRVRYTCIFSEIWAARVSLLWAVAAGWN